MISDRFSILFPVGILQHKSQYLNLKRLVKGIQPPNWGNRFPKRRPIDAPDHNQSKSGVRRSVSQARLRPSSSSRLDASALARSIIFVSSIPSCFGNLVLR